MLHGPSTRRIFFYNICTLGLYFFYWCSRSRRDINQSAQQELIPGTWYLAIPFLNYWWMWQYGQALEHVSFGRIKSSDTFLFFLIAMNLAFGGFSIFQYFPSSDSSSSSATSSISTTELLIIAGIVVAIMYFAVVLGAALFMSVMQRRINRLQPAAAPIAPTPPPTPNSLPPQDLQKQG